MPIPENQLETWCNQGAVVTSAAAYNSIRTALTASSSRVRELNPDIYLQGSYGNNTNIWADSDVDIVVQYNQAFYPDLSALVPLQQQAFTAAHSNQRYDWRAFHGDVLESLRSYYGAAAVVVGNKAIKVTVPNGRTADVVPAFQFRKYRAFQTIQHQLYVEGIQFEDRIGRPIINYPREHIANGVAKNAPERTNHRYKQIVRMFKNARNAAIGRHLIAEDVAPSYFVECLAYNAPDHLFVASRQNTFRAVLQYWSQHLSVDEALCQNEQIKLFGTSPQQWSTDHAAAFVNALELLWNTW
jgi:hypothetical protein